MAQGVPTTYYYSDSSISTWIATVSNTPNPEKVYTIGLVQYEAFTSLSEMQSFNTEAMKLGVMGTTIIVPSGDRGVLKDYIDATTNTRYLDCGYFAQFPASSPYVTAIGGTMGPELNNPEVTGTSCTQTTNQITSGGGFSVLKRVTVH